MSEDSKKQERPGRPKKILDKEQIRRLAELQCTRQEIAFVMNCSVDTLARHHKSDLEAGVALGKVKLRRAMFRNATEKDNATIQIWLSKNWLGYADTPVVEQDDLVLPWDTDNKAE